MKPDIRRRNRRVMATCFALVAGMVGLSFAAVPLYDLFCKVTGYGGTTQVAEQASGRVIERTVKVRFNAEVNRSLDWDFRPDVNEVAVKLGETGTVSYHASNPGPTGSAGTATFNVTPAKAGIYFNKIQCFCFEEQHLAAGQRVEMPVMFFVDPAMADDPNLADVNTITLSYTFFRAKGDEAPKQVSERAR
jgi:cytochrome c oxidase assembly protein subunit 11